MKKILFEQIGNIGMVTLFVVTLIQSVTMGSSIDESGLYIALGSVFWFFIIYSMLFGMMRTWFSRSKGNGGYSRRKGEFSAEDEREKEVASKAVRISYIALIGFTLISCMGVFIFGLVITDLTVLKIVALSVLGSIIIFGFFIYTISWVILDLMS